MNEVSAGDDIGLNIQCLTGISTSKRLQLGDFLQVNDEILRVKASPTDTTVQVHRGYLGTRQGNHPINSIIKKINVIPLEFRRPSILRASGHTFEYLGYGPGNYSTALPQVQLKTLSEREDFLVQAQERSCGAVIYTGMNSKGDTFNGNTKVSASSGQTTSYDIPKPTITGQDPSKLSVAFDEVTVRERILVEGGTSGFVLSQFDGPVTMTRSLRVKGKTTLNGQVRITSNNNNAGNENSGALIVKGGVGIGRDVYIRGKLEVAGVLQTNRGLLPDSDLSAFVGSATTAYSEAYFGNIQIAATADNTIDTRSGGLTIDATSGNLTQTASESVSVTASGGNLTQTASTGKVSIVASANDVEVNAGTGKSISLKKSTYITGDLEVRGPESVPPGLNSGTIRANYLEIPNITPVGGIVMWSGNEDQLPQLTVNGSVVTMWTVCDGRAISRSTYSALFNLIGTKFGSGNGSSTFNLPDLRNRFLIGSSSDSGSNIEGTTNRTGGSKDAEVIVHNHTLTAVGDHNHTVTVDSGGSHGHTITVDSGGSHGHTITVDNGGSHNHSITDPGHSHTVNNCAGKENADKGADPKTVGSNSDNRNTSSSGTGISINSGGTHNHGASSSNHSGHSHGASSSNHSGHSHGASSGDAGGHNHTVENSGVSGTNLNLPPYYALYYIMRIL